MITQIPPPHGWQQLPPPVVVATAILSSSDFGDGREKTTPDANMVTAILSSDFGDGRETTSPDAVVATAILSCGDDVQKIIINRRTLPGGERSSRSDGRTGRVTGRTRRDEDEAGDDPQRH